MINNTLLKILLLTSAFSLAIHFYISFFLSDVCVWNPGVAFGLMGFLPQNFLSTFVLFFLFTVVYIFIKFYRKYTEVAFILFFASFGNLVDRVFHGGVCDYVKLRFIINFPIFNLNDIFILVSLSLIFFIIFYDSAHRK